MLIGYADQLVIVVDVETDAAVPLGPTGAVPALPTRHWRRVSEGVSIQHEEARPVDSSHYCHCNESDTGR